MTTVVDIFTREPIPSQPLSTSKPVTIIELHRWYGETEELLMNDVAPARFAFEGGIFVVERKRKARSRARLGCQSVDVVFAVAREVSNA